MILDSASTSNKVARILLEELSEKIEGTLNLIAELNLEKSFTHNRQKYFMFFALLM